MYATLRIRFLQNVTGRASPTAMAGMVAALGVAAALPAQTFTEYPVPTPDSQMLGIAAGPAL